MALLVHREAFLPCLEQGRCIAKARRSEIDTPETDVFTQRTGMLLWTQ